MGGLVVYKIKYTDSTGNNDSIDKYNTRKEAENAIEEELESMKKCMSDYDYDDFMGEHGVVTEIWSSSNNKYACWERFYE